MSGYLEKLRKVEEELERSIIKKRRIPVPKTPKPPSPEIVPTEEIVKKDLKTDSVITSLLRRQEILEQRINELLMTREGNFNVLFNQGNYKSTPFYFHNLYDDTYYVLKDERRYGELYTTVVGTGWEEIFGDTMYNLMNTFFGITEPYDYYHFSECGMSAAAASFRFLIDNYNYGGLFGLADEYVTCDLPYLTWYLKRDDVLAIEENEATGAGIGTEIFITVKFDLYKKVTEDEAREYLTRIF